jgi:hypothetical protein
MPRVGFESTIPASERPKTVHALDRAATLNKYTNQKQFFFQNFTSNVKRIEISDFPYLRPLKKYLIQYIEIRKQFFWYSRGTDQRFH